MSERGVEPLPERLRVDDWQVRPRQGVIERGEVVVNVRPRAMEVLVYLATKAGEVVSNDELIEQLWAPAVVGDDAVMVVVSELRRALGDDPKHPTYIARIPKRGYQLIAAGGDGTHEPTLQSDLLSALEAVPPPFPAYDGDGAYVFVCYAHSDKTEVYPELVRLKEAGVNVWYDEGIPPASSWTEELAHAISNCEFFLYYVSPDSVASDSCRGEVEFALNPPRNKPMVVVHLERTTLPEGLELLIGGKQALLKYELAEVDYRRKVQGALDGMPVRSRPMPPSSAVDEQAAQSPQQRYRLFSVVALVVALAFTGWMTFDFPGESAGAPIRSLAVLPFDNLSGDPEQEYIADGMTIALIGELARLESLKVMPSISVMHYKDSDTSPREIASELGVRGLVSGTVIKEGGQFRVTVELVDGQTESYIWGDRFVRELSAVLALHADVARAVAKQIQLELTPREETQLAGSRQVDPEALEAYQKGVYHQNLSEMTGGPPESLRRSIEYYEEAISQDPGWALAHAALAEAYHFMGGPASLIGVEGVELYRKSKAASLKALVLDNDLARAHASLGYVLMIYDWDWEGAEQEYQRTFELDPNSYNVWGYAVLLWALGRYEEAIVRFKQAEERNPNPLFLKVSLGQVYYCTGQYDESVEQLHKVIELDPEDAYAHAALSTTYLGKSMYAEAIAQAELGGDAFLPELGRAYAVAGRTVEARAILRELEAKEHGFFPLLYAALDQKDMALDQIEASAERRDHRILMPLCRNWDSLRDEPRFQDLLQRMNLPQ